MFQLIEVVHGNEARARVTWDLLGEHNVSNALAAVAAARHAGVSIPVACQALGRFRNVKRRLERRASINGIEIYDDFAHHPTAIRTTLAGLRKRVGQARIIVILEPRSNTMRMGVHKDSLGPSLGEADLIFVYEPPDLGWDLRAAVANLGDRVHVYPSIQSIINDVMRAARPNEHVLIMSNGAFGGIHGKLIDALEGLYG